MFISKSVINSILYGMFFNFDAYINAYKVGEFTYFTYSRRSTINGFAFVIWIIEDGSAEYLITSFVYEYFIQINVSSK